MAIVKTLLSYRYRVTLQYLHTKSNTVTTILNESLKSLIIDNNYDPNCMPIIFANLRLDKSLVDDMIKNQNDNLFILIITMYDKNSEDPINIDCVREKCTYFLPNDVNKMNPIDYNEKTEESMLGDTYQIVTLGLMILNHINRNKVLCELSMKNVSNTDIVKNITFHFPDIIIEPFTYNDTFDQLILPSKDSVKKALEFLNNHRVFYSTPYRYYQDFNYAYIISSSGRPIDRSNDLYSSIVLTVKDVDDIAANDTGVIINRETNTYEVYLSYANTHVYDNTIVNKSKNRIRGITSSGASDLSLANNASYSNAKYSTIRLNNDNIHMLENIEASANMENFLLYFSKNDLPMDLFSLNKRITIHNIDRYQEYNGRYLLYRNRQIFIREDSTFVMNTMINLKRIDTSIS